MIKKLFIFFLAATWVFLAVGVSAKENPNQKSDSKLLLKPNQPAAVQSQANIGNMSYWVREDGWSGRSPITGNPGGIYPINTAGVIFQDGFIWGGIVDDNRAGTETWDDSIRVGGQTYVIGTAPGWITTPGTQSALPQTVDANLPEVAMYRIRADWRTFPDEITSFATFRQNFPSLVNDAALLNNVSIGNVTQAQVEQVISDYKESWKAWPVEQGAPFYDEDGNGEYDPVLDANGYPRTTDDSGNLLDRPGLADADQVLFYVTNDMDEGAATALYGSHPIGLEIQTTMWAYAQPGTKLGQIIFKRYRFLNKSGLNVDSMFVAQWSDPDVGFFTDDLVGNDTTLSLGFAYSGNPTDPNFEAFDLPPAAVGYDFFQGPLVASPGDTALFDFQEVADFKNLPMTAFGYFAAGSDISDPTLGDYEGTLEWYNLLNGFIPTDDIENPSPFIAGFGPTRGQPTKFPTAGDPVAVSGDIDAFGGNLPPGDRRLSLSSGPFTFEPWDDLDGDGLGDAGEPGVQEVVVAVIGGIVAQEGGNNRNAVAQLKLNDQTAQFVFDNRFAAVPQPPAPPKVTVTEMEDELFLDWGEDPQAVAETEKDLPLGYKFEGYNVYQLPSPDATKSQATRVQTFDKNNAILAIRGQQFIPQFGAIVEVPVQKGNNTGIQRFLKIDRDFINDQPLFAGNRYYFAVTAYNAKDANNDGQVDEPPDATLESGLNVIEVVPQTPVPGTVFGHEAGSTVDVEHTAGKSDGVVRVTVTDPKSVTGDQYRVTFDEDTDSTSATFGQLLWTVTNVTTGEVMVTGQPIETDIDAVTDQPIFDGIQVAVQGPPQEFKSIAEVQYAGDPVDPPDGVWHSLNSTAEFYVSATGSGNQSRIERYIDFAIPRDFEIRFVDDPTDPSSWSSFGVHVFEDDKIGRVPFELWDTGVSTPDDPSDDFRMIPFLLSNAGTSENWGWATGSDPAFGFPVSDAVYWMDPFETTTSTKSYDDFHATCVASGGAGSIYPFDGTLPHWGYFVNLHGGFVYPIGRTTYADFGGVGNPPPVGTIFRFITNKVVAADDEFTFDTQEMVQSEQAALDAVEEINVFPNPYYANNPSETGRFDRFVTFHHLPDKFTMRIFSLGGSQVRKLTEADKLSPESQFMQWNLRNESDLPVASGIYIVHIDMPDLGKEKILKVFIVQGAEILQFF